MSCIVLLKERLQRKINNLVESLDMVYKSPDLESRITQTMRRSAISSSHA